MNVENEDDGSEQKKAWQKSDKIDICQALDVFSFPYIKNGSIMPSTKITASTPATIAAIVLLVFGFFNFLLSDIIFFSIPLIETVQSLYVIPVSFSMHTHYLANDKLT